MTDIKLYKDIGLSQSMKRTVDFASKQEQIDWFTKKYSYNIMNVAYNKLQNTVAVPIGIDEMVESFSDAQTYTYCRVIDIEESGREYFCFIDSCILIDDSTVRFNLILDPIQTYMCEFSLDECMVNVAHIDRWNNGEPTRITPVTENINCFMNVSGIHKINPKVTNISMSTSSPEHINPENMWIVMMAYTYREAETTKVRRCYSLAGYKQDDYFFKMNGAFYEGLSSGYIARRMPSLNQVIRGQLPSIFNIPPEDVLFVCLLPFISNNIYARGKEGNLTEDAYEIDILPALTKHYIWSEKEKLAMWYDTDVFVESKESILFDNFVLQQTAQQPRNGDEKSPIYEPMLYMGPYRKTCVTDGTGNIILEIPDNKKLPTDYVTLKGKILTGNSSVSILFYVDNIAEDGTVGCSSISKPVYIDVINNHWLEYYLTERTQDRQMIANNNMNAAIDNLMFMAYGGALVGSRSASGKDDPYSKHGGETAAGVQKFKGLGGLPSAVGLASGASIVTSLVDTHYAWENQKQVESKIKNKPNGLLLVGGGQELANNITAKYNLVSLKCDDVNFNRAYARFTKYGYELNEFMKLDIRSRKYFNFVLTSGALIKGSLNSAIKEEIASIFDNGITIFHGDYCETLEYPNKENIERSLI